MRAVHRIEHSLYNVPVLAEPGLLEDVLAYLGTRNTAEAVSVFDNKHIQKRQPQFDPVSKVGTLKINGPLSYRATTLTALCELQSYQQIEADVRSLLDRGAKKILMVIDSGGGQAYSCFETANLLRNLTDANGAKLIAYVDGLAASAAYGIAASAHKVILNPYAEAGSIGVVVKLRNVNEAMQKMGVHDTYVYAGDSKIPFAKSGQWSEEFIGDVQMKVDKVYKSFIDHVAKYRSMSAQVVIDTRAKVFSASDAVKIGLADALMDREELQEYLNTGKKPAIRAPSIASPSTAAPSIVKPKADSVSTALQRRHKVLLDEKTKQKRKHLIFGIARTLSDADFIYMQTRHLSDDEFNERIKKLAI